MEWNIVAQRGTAKGSKESRSLVSFGMTMQFKDQDGGKILP